MKLRALTSWQSLRASYWFVPAMLAVGAVVLAAVTLRLDAALTATQAGRTPWLYSGGANGARSMLAAIATSAIAVAGTTYAITIAVLQLASSQFGPRLLRNFMRDTGNQLVLGVFIATFLYCLLVLRRVRGQDDFAFVPHLSVTVGTALAVVSVSVLIYFIHHIASSIQAANVIATVGRELDAAIARLFPESIGQRVKSDAVPRGAAGLPLNFDREAAPLASRGSGYILAVDLERLVTLAREQEVILRLDHRPGDFVIDGRPLASVWPADRTTEALEAAISAAVVLGSERSQEQDAGFLINQLVEIAVRAL
jgi:uncharacterized membrane protein